ncbi:LADA_0H13344g1_1 [Lachancea dasiensis]|uniref:LADA_0H13344g1_1 n=1 Tax=Lachancea dasiensis TaxID=1072105 RepID=A0A1G4K4B9_9SACH|nr:LADA_0H13344g1_1 [Lachancea dasiensis]
MDVSSAATTAAQPVNATGPTPGILINNNQSSVSSQHGGMTANASNMAKLRRESIAHSQGMGGVSWGSLTIGSWLRDEVMIHTHMSQAHSNNGGLIQNNNGQNVPATVNLAAGNSFSPPGASSAYLPNLEKQYCKDYSCCGLLLPGLHDLLRHYEEAHISTSPGTINTHASTMANIPVSTGAGASGGIPGMSNAAGSGFTGPSVGHAANNNALKKQRMAAIYQQQLQHDQQQRQHHNQPGLQQRQQQQSQQHLQQNHQSSQHRSLNAQQELQHQANPHLQHPLTDHQQHQNAQFQQSPKLSQPHNDNGHLQQQMQNQMFHQAMQQQLHGVPHNAGANTTSSVQQLHLNGNLVDAVSTNEVFLQTGAGQSGKRGQMVNQAVSNGSFNNHNKMQPGFNNYSLNMQPLGKQGMDSSTMQQFQQGQHQQGGLQQQQHFQQQRKNAQIQQQQHHHQQQIQQQQHQQRLMGNASNSALNRNQFTSQVGTAGAGIDLDFMDADMIDDLHDGNAIVGGAPVMTPEMAKAWKQMEAGQTTKMSSHRPKVGNGHDSDSSLSEDDEEDEVVATTVPATAVNKRKQQPGFIDDPARRLYVMDHEEHKPFKCPVIGCDKTYKNQNGLKYHKLHGHQNQKLHENPDGTFSIIDPESNEPYPDGMGFEKDKPYRCEVCGKRYKNLNGLKYHRGHSTH